MQYEIEIKHISSKVGRGVFASKNFKAGEVIERCPVIRLTPRERKHCSKTALEYYMYPWRSTRSASIALGYGSLYNHSFNPNADWKQNSSGQQKF